MRPFVIELLAEEVEPALLVGRGCFRRIAGFALERAVHALVAAVLLRLARIDPLQLNPHLRPARREPRQPAGFSLRLSMSRPTSSAGVAPPCRCAPHPRPPSPSHPSHAPPPPPRKP